MSKKKKFDPFEEERVDSVEAVKAELSPETPCVHADAEGYCTGACEGSICCHCADYKPVTAVATQTAATDIVLEPTKGATAADCVQHDLQMSRKHAAYSAAYLARAGWQLAQEKVRLGHGGWEKWCKENLGFSKDTADRYIAFYHATVGKWREAQGLANTMVAELTDKMIAAATRELEYKTGTQAMIELGVIKRPAKWGGEREGAGRKAAELPKLTKVQEAETVWAGLMAQLDKTVVMDTIPLLGAKAARVCHDRVAELARALKEHLKEF